MIRVNIHDAKANLSRYLDLVEDGETVVVCRRNVPIAELRRVKQQESDPRPIGLAARDFAVPDSFFEPLPADVLEAFEGRGGDR